MFNDNNYIRCCEFLIN